MSQEEAIKLEQEIKPKVELAKIITPPKDYFNKTPKASETLPYKPDPIDIEVVNKFAPSIKKV